MTKNKEEMVECILVNSETGLPFPGDEPFFITQREYDSLVELAKRENVSVDEIFIRAIRAGIELVKEKVNTETSL